MKNEICYKIAGTLYRSKGKEVNLIEIDKTLDKEIGNTILEWFNII
jgi:hypothetical protein